MEIRTEVPSDWDEIISAFNPSPFLSSAYLESMKNERLGTIYLTFREDGEVIGGISGIVEHNRLIKNLKLFRSIIFYTGPFLVDASRGDDCWKELIQFIIKEGYIKFKNLGYDISLKPPNNTQEGSKIKRDEDYIIRLDEKWENINKRIKKRIRRKLRRANEAGLTFHTSNDPEMVNVLLDLIEQTAEFREKRGLTGFKIDYIRYLNKDAMMRQIKSKIVFLGVVKLNDEILSIHYIIRSGTRAYGIFIATTEKGYDLGANALNFKGTMEHFWKIGVKLFNTGGVPGIGADGLIQFKLGLGAIPVETWSMISPIINRGPKGYIFKIYQRIKTPHELHAHDKV